MRFVLVISVLFFVACTEAGEEKNYVTTRVALTPAARATAKLGEDCTANGQSNCLSGFCLSLRAGFVCTSICERDAECPVDWTCGVVGPNASVCVPPEKWKPRPAIVRPTSSSSLRTDGGER